jgi:hypothetical protein
MFSHDGLDHAYGYFGRGAGIILKSKISEISEA